MILVDPGRIVLRSTHFRRENCQFRVTGGKKMAQGVGIRELKPPKCGPRGGDPDEAALPHPGGLETDLEGCLRSPPPGATFLRTLGNGNGLLEKNSRFEYISCVGIQQL